MDERSTRQIINRNAEIFESFYHYENILDFAGRQQRRTMLMAQEMCNMLTAKLHTSRIKDPEKRAMVISFQRSLMYIFHLLRTGRLRGAYVMKSQAPAEYQRILSLPPGRATAAACRELAAAEGLCVQQVYERLRKIRGGSNAITSKGVPKKKRSDAGMSRNKAA